MSNEYFIDSAHEFAALAQTTRAQVAITDRKAILVEAMKSWP